MLSPRYQGAGFFMSPHHPDSSTVPHPSRTTPSTSSPAAVCINLANHILISPTKHRQLQRLPLLLGQGSVGDQGQKLGCGCQRRCAHPRSRRAPKRCLRRHKELLVSLAAVGLGGCSCGDDRGNNQQASCNQTEHRRVSGAHLGNRSDQRH